MHSICISNCWSMHILYPVVPLGWRQPGLSHRIGWSTAVNIPYFSPKIWLLQLYEEVIEIVYRRGDNMAPCFTPSLMLKVLNSYHYYLTTLSRMTRNTISSVSTRYGPRFPFGRICGIAHHATLYRRLSSHPGGQHKPSYLSPWCAGWLPGISFQCEGSLHQVWTLPGVG